MMEKLLALLSMFAFGLVCGMMLRDWQARRMGERKRQAELEAQWRRVSRTPPPPPSPDQVPMSDYL